MDVLAAALERSPELFPHSYDPGADTVSFLPLSEEDYRRASFLDARLLGRQAATRTVPRVQLEAAIAEAGLSEGCDFIFHIGHTGSTLLSRLLATDPRVLPIREPMILRTLAQPAAGTVPDSELDARLALFLKLWSRSFRSGQGPIVKASSFVSELAARILARPYRPKAIFLFVPPRTYLATILAGPNSRQETKMLAPARLARLHRRLGSNAWNLSALSEGEAIAMSWACEMCALADAGREAGDRVLWLDFDDFLADPQAGLSAAFRHLGVAVDSAAVAAILAGPEMRRYAKATEHAYDAQLRRELLRRAEAEQGEEIARGLAWLERAGSEFPQIRDQLTTRANAGLPGEAAPATRSPSSR
jgi:hypothetical protein